MIGLFLMIGAGCSEYRIHDPPTVEPAEPPGRDDDVFGDPPDWSDCREAYLGQYFNLQSGDPGVLDEEDTGALPLLDADADLWAADRLSFQRYDPTVDFGSNWWPVDEGIAGDPLAFSARWTAWIRVLSRGDLSISLGAANDGQVILNEKLVAEVSGSEAFSPQTTTFEQQPGQFTLDLRFAQRGGHESGFRFRLLSGDAVICYPDFSDEG